MKKVLCIGRISLVTAIFMALPACSGHPDNILFDYADTDGARYTEKYKQAIKQAQAHQLREEYLLAARELLIASKEELFEWPNYELWDDIASASCLAEEYYQCQRYADYYEAALNVIDGTTVCYSTEEDENLGAANPDLPPLVAEVMCHPAFTYGFGGNASSDIKQEVQQERAQLWSIKKMLRH